MIPWLIASAGELGLLASVFAMSALCSCALTQHGDRRLAVHLTMLGMMVASIKIYLIQQTSQWSDTPLDSITYQIHADAMAAHWSGQPVDAELSRLAGFLAFYDTDGLGTWFPSSSLSYSSVFGTHEWLYASYLALWKVVTPDWVSWATYSNAAMAALFPAAAFGLARILGASRSVGLLAAGLALIDPSAAVNASWLLKDTLAGWAFLATLWSGAILLRQQKPYLLLFFACSLALLGGVRFAALAAVLLAVVVMLPVLFVKGRRIAALALLVATMGGIYLFAIIDSMPSSNPLALFGQPFASVQGILAGQQDTLRTSVAESQQLAPSVAPPAVDQTVVDWYSRLTDSPLTAMATAVARTLFAPYPWVVFTRGLDYHNGIELYYLGVLLWIACLPGLLMGLTVRLIRPNLEFVFFVLTVGALLCAYVLFMGEWSTRQRVFALPVLFAITAIGVADVNVQLARWWKRRMSGHQKQQNLP